MKHRLDLPCGTQLFAEVVDHPVFLVERERSRVLRSREGEDKTKNRNKNTHTDL